METRRFLWVIVIFAGLATTVRSQLLDGDPQFPILNEMRWNMSYEEIRTFCEARRVMQKLEDSSIVFRGSLFGFAALIDARFEPTSRRLTLFQVKFPNSVKAIEDSLVNHFTRMLKREPKRVSKEKNFVILSLRMEMALWRTQKDLINVVTTYRGDTLISAGLLLTPTTH